MTDQPTKTARPIRRALLVAAALFVLLVGVLLGRALSFGSVQITPPAPEAIPLPEARVLAERLGGAVQIQTVSHIDPTKVDWTTFEALRSYLQTSFPKVHGKMTREIIADHSLLYTWTGTKPDLPPIALIAHLDVVPVPDEDLPKWTEQPYSGKVTDTHVWGRGTMDNKNGVLGLLEAAEALIGAGWTPERTILLAFGHDEEVGGKGAQAIAAHMKAKKIAPAFLLDEGLMITEGIVPGIDAPIGLIGVAEKGFLSLELSVELEGGHSSTPPKETAVGILATAVSKMEKNPLPDRLDGAALAMFETLGPEMPFGQRLAMANLWLLDPIVRGQLGNKPATNAMIRTTTAPTMFQGSQRDNVLPNRATAVINFRLLPGDTIASVTEFARNTINDPRVTLKSLGGLQDEPSPVSDPTSESFKTLERTTRQIYPEAIVAPALFIAAADARHYTDLTPNVYRFLPQRLTPEGRTRFHGIDERMAIDDYARLVHFYAQLMKNSAGNP